MRWAPAFGVALEAGLISLDHVAALSVLDATKVENTLRQIANELFHASGDDGTTLAQRIADVLVVLVDRFNGHSGSNGNAKPTRPTLVVICSEESLRGQLDNAGLGHTRSHAEGWTYTRDPHGHLTVNTRDGTEIPTRKPRKPRTYGEPSPAHAPPGALFAMN